MVDEFANSSVVNDRLCLEDIFPGIEGRMEMIRVMIYLRRPDLRDVDRRAPLGRDLVAAIARAREEIRHG